ncbi:GNAT family N-acetyltransferase [Aerococcus urinae]|uniref:GNAT family N-acetyltransferase n=1 Tax=Aerococcus TaxID=1375 RepID=UPI000DCB90A1|nr:MULTISPECIES: GNAT family N-acetyltransferase [Aerococcus]MCY3034521.1 GNAT family N-acetyltransferase [Aerococcus mictus]MCY3063475.1 GNAT family N-acetyltransferase [Aerococcus mictus]MCY3072910.1 GNAT family N-acetyltransferase [Aerococcus mictus]MCY3084054.1 GNAT family N-acetyltransferase [Aerococcus mictus]MDK7195251.1 GNAT family N-acetyltransferase [Aerococcus urinae]
MTTIRPIQAKDDDQIAKIIRNALESVGLDKPGTAYYDPELDHLSQFYQVKPKSRGYFLAVDDSDQVLGGVGFAECDLFDHCAELQKIYLAPQAQGQGLGRALMEKLIQEVKSAAYRQLYLETHSSLKAAIGLYQKYGFKEISQPENLIHTTMDRFFLKDLSD